MTLRISRNSVRQVDSIADLLALDETSGLRDRQLVEDPTGRLWRFLTAAQGVMPPWAADRSPTLLQRVRGDESPLVPGSPVAGVDWQWLQAAGTPEAPSSVDGWMELEAESGEQGLLVFQHDLDFDEAPFELFVIGEFHLSEFTANDATAEGAKVQLDDGSEDWAYTFQSGGTTRVDAVNGSDAVQPENMRRVDPASPVALVFRSVYHDATYQSSVAEDLTIPAPFSASGASRFTATADERFAFTIGNGQSSPNDNFGVLKLRNVRLLRLDTA